ncbi:hypothetical protein D1BOALGB6SA_5958 [Olavius sp. associated proteobacterium Delta 1]|nr:hypothetical protein D1BOALGB6SA_5958 [Olavius sp. associated proteobacterium Delta 1]
MTPPNLSPFTSRRQKFMHALSEVLRELDDPEREDVSTIYEYRSENTKTFGSIPKLKFLPFGKDCYMKAEVMRRAGLVNQELQDKVKQLRKDLGFKGARDEEHRILARRFESYWNNWMHQITKATKALSYTNYALCKQGQRLAKPVRLIQQTTMQATRQSEKKQPGDICEKNM